MHSFIRHQIASLSTVAIAATLAPAIGTAQSQPTAQIPTRFVQNAGQWSSPELYRVDVGGLNVFLEPRGWSFWLQDAPVSELPPGARARPGIEWDLDTAPRRAIALRMSFLGDRAPRVVPEGETSGRTSFFVGADRDRHRAAVPSHAAIRYESMYDGIDVRVRESAGQFEYDLLLAPGADLAQVEVQVDGAGSVTVDEAGGLVLHTELGDVVQPRPATWMVTANGEKLPVTCDYVLRGPGRFGFVAPDRDAELALVVDPPLVYSTFLGGSDNDTPNMVIEDGNGRILVCGVTRSVDFPVRTGSMQTTFGGGTNDGYIVCLDPAQPPANQVVFATYFGGTDNDNIRAITLLPNGLIAFSGQTRSLGLPVTAGAVQTTHAGGIVDGFIGVLDPTGSTLISLTYLGGSGLDQVNSIKAAPAGDLLFAGITRSADFPTTANAFQPTHAGGPSLQQDGLLGRIDLAATSLTYSTFLGGSGEEWIECHDVDSAGVMTMIGGTSSIDFPTTANAYDTSHNGGSVYYWWSRDAVVFRVDPTLPPAQQLVYSTFLGGALQEQPFALRIASNGDLVVSGVTNSLDFPSTSDVYQPQTNGGGFISTSYLAGDGFVVRLDPNVAGAAGMVFGTHIGGAGQDQGIGLVLDSTDEITLVGWSSNLRNDFPTTPDAVRRVYGFEDGFVARLSADGRQLLYSTYLGGISSSDGAWLVARHADGMPTVAGATNAADFPTERAAQPTYGGNTDGFVTRMSLIAENTRRLGSPSPSAGRWPTIHALGDAVAGNAQFGIACSQVAPNVPGVLLLGLGASGPVSLLGIEFLVDLPTLIVSFPLPNSDAQGESATPLALPPTPIGTLYAQYVWVNSLAPFTLSASDALCFTVR